MRKFAPEHINPFVLLIAFCCLTIFLPKGYFCEMMGWHPLIFKSVLSRSWMVTSSFLAKLTRMLFRRLFRYNL